MANSCSFFITAKAQIFLSNHGLNGLYGFLFQTKTLNARRLRRFFERLPTKDASLKNPACAAKT